jgi:hypothetical protein
VASLKDLTGGQKPVIAYPKTIQFGPVVLEGYMLENGEFRQSIGSTERALGADGSKLFQRLLVPRSKSSVPVLTGQTPNPLQRNGSGLENAENGQTPLPIIVPVRCAGVAGLSGVIHTINLPMVVEGWKHIAMSDSKYSRTALELLGLAAVHSLERVYQEAFGIQDNRTTQDRLLDWAIRLDVGKHYPLFGGDFHRHFARVTGVTLGHRYAQVCLAELVYHRLPEPIYETLKDLNPIDEKGWRQFSHSQLMTDNMRQQMREIIAAVTSQLANTASKANDPKAYKRCLHRLDKTLPRYKSRKSSTSGDVSHLARWREEQKNG